MVIGKGPCRPKIADIARANAAAPEAAGLCIYTNPH